MGIEDQFKDKAQDLSDRAQDAISGAKEEHSPRGQAQEREQQEQDAQDGDEN